MANRDDLRKLIIDTKEELTNARYCLNGLDLILEGLPDKRTASACMTIFSMTEKKLEAVDDMLDQLYRDLSALDRELDEIERNRPRRD